MVSDRNPPHQTQGRDQAQETAELDPASGQDGRCACVGGNFIQTEDGPFFLPACAEKVEGWVCKNLISLRTIARALTSTYRFGGHTTRPITVAEHSLNVLDLVQGCGANRETMCWALLHDAAEAWLGDVPTPVKALLPNYAHLEAAVARAVRLAFGLAPSLIDYGLVDRADKTMLSTEAERFLPGGPWRNWHLRFGDPIPHYDWPTTYMTMPASHFVRRAGILGMTDGENHGQQ